MGSDHLSGAAWHSLLANDAALHDAAIEEEGAEDTEHDDDEHGAEDEEEILVEVELVLSVDDGSILSAGVCPHDRMIFHFNSIPAILLALPRLLTPFDLKLKCCDRQWQGRLKCLKVIQ